MAPCRHGILIRVGKGTKKDSAHRAILLFPSYPYLVKTTSHSSRWDGVLRGLWIKPSPSDWYPSYDMVNLQPSSSPENSQIGVYLWPIRVYSCDLMRRGGIVRDLLSAMGIKAVPNCPSHILWAVQDMKKSRSRRCSTQGSSSIKLTLDS